MKSSQRLKRVNQLVRQELSVILRSEFPLAKLDLASVQEVRVSRDLKYADVFINYLGSTEDRQRVVAFLSQHRGRIQNLLGTRIHLKETPHLRFIEDVAIDRGSRILEIMQELEQEDEAADRDHPQEGASDERPDAEHP